MNLTDPCAEEKKRRVALFATNFVAYSQTFIFDEITRHVRYEADVFTRNRINADAFPFNRVHALGPAQGLMQRAEGLMYAATTFSPTFRKKIKGGAYDILHAHFGPASIYALPYKFAADLPLVTTYHGYDVPFLLSKARFHPKYWRYWARSGTMLRQVDRFLAASSELADLLVELGAPKDRIHVFRLGIDIPLSVDTSSRNGTKLLIVGRFVEKKGIAYGIEAVHQLIQNRVPCTLDIVGDGPLRPTYDKLIASLGLEQHVRFLGVKSQPEVHALMEKCDVLLAPSVVAANGDRDSGLIVAKEASARAVPVAGTRHGGIPEIIHDGKTGFLVPERDTKALAEAIRILLETPSLRHQFGEAARKKMIEEYDINHRVAVLENHYDEVISMYQKKRR